MGRTGRPDPEILEAVGFHDLGPGRDEIRHEAFTRIILSIKLSQGPQLRVRAEDKVDSGRCPLHLIAAAIAHFKGIVTGCNPFRRV